MQFTFTTASKEVKAARKLDSFATPGTVAEAFAKKWIAAHAQAHINEKASDHEVAEGDVSISPNGMEMETDGGDWAKASIDWIGDSDNVILTIETGWH